MRNFSLVLLLLGLLTGASWGQTPSGSPMIPSGGFGSSSIINGATPCTGCATGGVLFNNGGVVTASTTLPSGLTIPGFVPQVITTASASGCALNSNINSGGGTDDTTCLQNGINALAAQGGGTFVIDGVALISNALVVFPSRSTALVLPSNVSIQVIEAGGVFLAAGSDCGMISNNSLNGSSITTTNISISGGVWNGNGANQDIWEQNNSMSPHEWVMGMWFSGVDGLTLSNVTIRNATKFAIILSNDTNVKITNSIATWDTAQTGNEDALHMWSPLNNVFVDGLSSNGNDDVLAFNTDEQTMWGDARRGSSGGQGIQNVTANNINLLNTQNGVRFLGSFGGAGVTVNNIVIQHVSGFITTVTMLFSGVTAGSITFNDWAVYGAHAGINVGNVTTLSLNDILAGTTVTLGTIGTSLGNFFTTSQTGKPWEIFGTGVTATMIGPDSYAVNRNFNTGSSFSNTGFGYQWQHTISTTAASDTWCLGVYTTTGSTVANCVFGINGAGAISWGASGTLFTAASGSLSGPGYTFSAAPTTGFYLPAVGTMAVAVGATRTFNFNATDFFANNGTGPTMRTNTPTATVPSLVPNQINISTGVGAQGNNISEIVGGAEIGRWVSTGLAVQSSTDATSVSTGAVQVPGGMSVNKRVWMNGITASSGLQTAVLCQSSGGEVIADSVACLASSRDLKEGFLDLNASYNRDVVDRLKPMSWRYRHEEGSVFPKNYYRERIGFIAEDVAAIDPRLVELDKTGNPRAIDYNGIVGVLTSRVREMSIEIEALKQKAN